MCSCSSIEVKDCCYSVLVLSAVGIHCFVSTSGITTINQANKAFIRRTLGIQFLLPCWKSSTVAEALPGHHLLLKCYYSPACQVSHPEQYVHTPCSKAWISPMCKSWSLASHALGPLMPKMSALWSTRHWPVASSVQEMWSMSEDGTSMAIVCRIMCSCFKRGFLY